MHLERAGQAHAYALARSIRWADAEELAALGFASPAEALLESVAVSAVAYALFFDGEPAALCGVMEYRPKTALGGADSGRVWALTGEVVSRRRKDFLRCSRDLLAFFLSKYSYLEAVVDSRYDASLRWARWLGFTVREPRLFPFSTVPFCHISIRRE